MTVQLADAFDQNARPWVLWVSISRPLGPQSAGFKPVVKTLGQRIECFGGPGCLPPPWDHLGAWRGAGRRAGLRALGTGSWDFSGPVSLIRQRSLIRHS